MEEEKIRKNSSDTVAIDEFELITIFTHLYNKSNSTNARYWYHKKLTVKLRSELNIFRQDLTLIAGARAEGQSALIWARWNCILLKSFTHP